MLRPAPQSRPTRRVRPPAPLRAAVAALPQPAVITAGPWREGGADILFANAAFTALTGYSAAEAAAGNTRMLLGPRTDLVLLQHGLRGAPPQSEGWLHRKDGSAFHAQWHFVPLPGGLRLGVYRDQTELRRLQEALVHSQRLETVGQLAGGMAHDFNNLLSVINGYCEILAPKIGPLPAAAKDLREIHRAGLKAATIARQILEFSRRTEPEERVINFNVLVREIADILRRALGDGIALELRLASDLGNVRADPTQFQQALLNLCFNARDAMPGGGRVVIRTFNHTAPGPEPRAGSYAALAVGDTGPGMTEAVRQRMFDPFFTTKPHGTGLGLPMAQGFVRQHGGHIAVRSEPGQGAAFELYLPDTPESARTFSTALPALPAARGSERVLLFEPDDILCKMVSGILATDGYRVTTAASFGAVRDALAAKDARPDLLIVDCAAKNAAVLARSLREAGPGPKVLCVANTAPPALAGLAPGTIAHLPKPFALSALLRAARNLLDGSTGG